MIVWKENPAQGPRKGQPYPGRCALSRIQLQGREGGIMTRYPWVELLERKGFAYRFPHPLGLSVCLRMILLLSDIADDRMR
jgi:hypothetical protein